MRDMERAGPVTRARAPARGFRRRRRWPGFSWWLSALFAVGIGAWAVTLLVDPGGDADPGPQSNERVLITITDSSSGQPVAGAEVRFGDASAVTNETGIAQLNYSNEPMVVTVTRDGYHPVYGRLDATMSTAQRIAMNPAGRGEATSTGTAVAASGGETAESDDTAALAQDSQPGDPGDSAGLAGVAGVVVDAAGQPISTATILAGSDVVFSDDEGYFEAPNAVAGSQLRVWASGYADQFPTATAGGDIIVQMSRMDIKAAYLTGARLGDEAKISELIGVIESTELNALVIDIKEGQVYYDTQVQFFRDAEAVSPVFDPQALLQRLKEHDIYTIARIVVFNDPIVAENRPDLALKDDNGGVWRGWNGGAWVDPFKRELWQPNIDLALEAARMGFDEIQYDYVRFPSDGDLSTANFAGEYSEESRVSTIVEFLEMTQEQLRPAGVKLGADVFGIIAVYPEDQGIGQRLADFAAVVDFVHPMMYPSHFDEGSIGVDGHPNEFPYETMDISVGLGMAKIPGMEFKMRPWLQDFTLGDRVYGPEEVQAQIDATM